MRTIVKLGVLLLLIQGCSKQDSDSLQLNSDFFLDFDIEKFDYNEPNGESMTVRSIQDTESIIFQDVSTLDRYLYLGQTVEVGSDSVTLLGAINFTNTEVSTFDEEKFMLEFFMTLDKSELITLSDSTYQLKNNETLYLKLRDEGWGHQQLFGSNYINQILLSLPNISDESHSWGMDILSSNGFYFDAEAINLSTIDYDESTDSIILGGEFNVGIKTLSCGFYIFYEVENAKFLIEIK